VAGVVARASEHDVSGSRMASPIGLLITHILYAVVRAIPSGISVFRYGLAETVTLESDWQHYILLENGYFVRQKNSTARNTREYTQLHAESERLLKEDRAKEDTEGLRILAMKVDSWKP
jgi:hypothetical protein